MHRLRSFVLSAALAAITLGVSPAFEGGARALRAGGTEFLYLKWWGLEVCWSDCAEGATCCKLVYLVED